MLHAIPFFEKVGTYECSYKGNWSPCTQKEICVDQSGIEYRPITSGEFYIQNWVSQLDLLCEEKYRIGLIGSSFFIGLLVGLPFIPYLADRYGRKPVFTGAMIASLIFQLGITFSTNLNFTLVCLNGCGLLYSARFIVGLSYAEELMAPRYKQTVISTNWLFSASTVFIIPLILLFITNNLQFINALGLVQLAFALAIVPWYIPESPKYYYENDRFDDARKSMSQIAGKNGLKLSEIKFDREHHD